MTGRKVPFWEYLGVLVVGIVVDWAILRWAFGVSSRNAAMLAWLVQGLYMPLYKLMVFFDL